MENVRVKFTLNFDESEKDKIREAVKEVLELEGNEWLKEKYENEDVHIYSSLKCTKATKIWKAFITFADKEPRYPNIQLPGHLIPKEKRRGYLVTKREIASIELDESVFPWMQDNDPALDKYFGEGV